MLEGIIPAVFIQRTVFDRTYRVLPLIAGFKTVAFDDAATGETEYTGVEVVKGLRQVGTQTILTSFPSVDGEEGDVVHVYCTFSFQNDTQAGMGIGERRFQHSGQFLPVAAAHFYFFFQKILGIGIHQFDGEFHRLGIRCTGIYGKTVFFALLHADAAIAFIIQSGTQQATVIDYTHVMRIAVETGICILHGYIAERHPTDERLREFKRTVLH